MGLWGTGCGRCDCTVRVETIDANVRFVILCLECYDVVTASLHRGRLSERPTRAPPSVVECAFLIMLLILGQQNENTLKS